MQHNDNVPNSGSTESKDQIVKEFLRITEELSQPDCRTALSNQRHIYKSKINQLKEQGLLTAQDAWNISQSYHNMANNSVLIKQGRVSVKHCLAQHDSWSGYSKKLALDELQNLVKSTYEALQIFTSNEQSQSEHSNLEKNLKSIIKGYKDGKINRESMVPLVDIIVKFYLNIMDKLARAELDERLLLSPKRIFIRDALLQLQEVQLISADDAYKIALAYVHVSTTKNFEPMVTLKRQREWKIYAAQEGQIEAIKEINPGNEFFIRQVWEDFMKANLVDVNKANITLFTHNVHDQALRSIQQQLDACSDTNSIHSSKRMLQVIAEFYFDQYESKKPNDKFLQELSLLLLDILLTLAKSDKTIKTVLDEESTNAFELVYKIRNKPSEAQLKQLVLQCSPILLKNTLTSLHMARPKVNRTTDLGTHYDIGNNL